MKHYTDDELGAYLDNELSPDKYNEIEEHLADCASCQQKLEKWQALGKVLSKAPELEASEPFVNDVMQRLASVEDISSTFSFYEWLREWSVPAVGVAFSVILLLLQANDLSFSSEEMLFAALPNAEAPLFIIEDMDTDLLLGISLD